MPKDRSAELEKLLRSATEIAFQNLLDENLDGALVAKFVTFLNGALEAHRATRVIRYPDGSMDIAFGKKFPSWDKAGRAPEPEG